MIVWCASYPKSGNTWIKAIITSLLYSEEGIFNFDLLKKIGQFPIRHQFKEFIDDYSNLKKISDNWIKAQEKINFDGKLRIFKTHHGNYNFLGNNFTNKKNTSGVIYIVRDPRNMITSIANHFQYDLKTSTNFLLEERKLLFTSDPKNPRYKSEENIVNILGSWKDHYNSWKTSSNLIIIKYEDLLSDTKSQINKLIIFLKKFGNFEVNNEKIDNIIRTTSFETLQRNEKKYGFKEAINKKIKFFNLGPKNIWKNVVDEKLIYKIEKNFKNEMKELNYL
tara:strand:+ start:1270 stop:2106 length:837 start_codon:yes stop_codon:yes gene_type:complete